MTRRFELCLFSRLGRVSALAFVISISYISNAPYPLGPVNTKGVPKVSRVHKLFLCQCFWLPVLAFGQPPTSTSTTSRSVGTGTTNAIFASSSLAIGPGQIAIGDRGTCSISGPPYPSCVPSGGGAGTPADPFGYTCNDLPLTNCSLGTTFVVVAGSTNINIHTHRQNAIPAVAVAGPAAAVPFSPSVPIGSGLGIALLATLALLRRKR